MTERKSQSGIGLCFKNEPIEFVQVTKANLKEIEAWLKTRTWFPKAHLSSGNNVSFKYGDFELHCTLGDYIVMDGKATVVAKEDFGKLYEGGSGGRIIFTLFDTPSASDDFEVKNFNILFPKRTPELESAILVKECSSMLVEQLERTGLDVRLMDDASNGPLEGKE